MQVLRAVPLVVVALMAIINLARGSVHAFAADGGAHSIGGLDLTSGGQTILSLFAVIGLHQIVLGLLELYVLIARRDLLALVLGYQLLQTISGVANLYFYRTLPVPVPGAPFNAAVLAVIAIAFVIALASRVRPAPSSRIS
jgi:hypothetical protein